MSLEAIEKVTQVENEVRERRAAAESAGQKSDISTSDDVDALFRPLLVGLQHEECWVVYLTASNRIIERQQVSRGGVQGKRAIELLATRLVLVHNHPSGTAEPSAQDKQLTERIAAAASLFDIQLLDHLIIARGGNFSFRREGLIHF